MNEDAELLRCYAQTRSESAFAELVRRRVGLVYSVALLRTRNVQLAEDATQAVFADLARKAAALSKHPVLAGWLQRSAHYAATDILRAETRRAAREQEAQLMHDISANDQAPETWEKVKPLLHEVLSELGEVDRDAVLLRFFDGRSFAEIGAQLQLTENAARMRVERALDKLQAALARRDIRSTTAVVGAVLAQQGMLAAPAGLAATVTQGALAAGAVAVSSPALALFQLMTTTKMVAGLAGVALTIAALGTAYETRRRSSAEATLASATREQAALAEQLTRLTQRTQTAEQAAEVLRAKADEAARAAAEANARAVQSAKTKVPWDPVAEGKALLTRHPELKRVVVEGTDAGTRFTFSGVYQTLELTPAQIARFEELMREWSTTTVPLNGETAVIPAGTGMSWNEVDAALTALLGADKKRKLLEYAQAAPDRHLTASLVSALCFTDAPLTTAQAQQMAQIIAASRARPQSWGPGELDWGAVATKARAVLSAPQLAALDGLQAQAAEQALLYSPIK